MTDDDKLDARFGVRKLLSARTDDDKLEAIAGALNAMDPAERFRLVATLLEKRKARLALAVATLATESLRGALVAHERRQK